MGGSETAVKFFENIFRWWPTGKIYQSRSDRNGSKMAATPIVNYSNCDRSDRSAMGSELPFEYLFKMADWVNNCPNDLVYCPAAYLLKAAIHILQPQPYATHRRVICGPIALAGARAP
jgi:hypothetical protein